MAYMTKAKDALCLRFSIVAGTGTATNIACTGITTEDTIIAAWTAGVGATSTAVPDDVTDEVSITSDGYVQHSTTALGGSKYIHILWADNSR